jgi:hypothetical protein
MTDNALTVITEFDTPPTKARIRARIENLDVSADAKAILFDFIDTVVAVGGKVLAVGRQILAFIFDLCERFPNTAFGLIIATVISTLIAAIPGLGPYLAPILAPLLLALGLAGGAVADLKDAVIRSRILRLEQYYAQSFAASARQV